MKRSIAFLLALAAIACFAAAQARYPSVSGTVVDPIAGTYIAQAVQGEPVLYTIRVQTSNDFYTKKVDFLLDGTIVGSDRSAPFTCVVDFSTVAVGPHAVSAVIYGMDKSVTNTQEVPITVVAPIEGPTGKL